MVFYFHFRVLSSILSLSFLCSSVSEALFTLSFSYLSERFDKAALARSQKINNMGVTGRSLPPKNDFEHARGLRNSAYAVNLTYETYRHIHIYYIPPPLTVHFSMTHSVRYQPKNGSHYRASEVVPLSFQKQNREEGETE